MENSAEDGEIVIIGGGICGLATALALHRKGIRSLVLERSDKLRATGAAIIMQANGWHALDQLGVASSLRHTAIPIQRGKTILLSEAEEEKETPLGTSKEFRCLKRADLIKAMANNLPVGTIRTSCQVLSIKLDPVTHFQHLTLSDGTILQAKAVIGCDGVNSIVASMVGLRPVRFLPLSTCVARGFTYYPDGHQFGAEFVMIIKDQVRLGRVPVSYNLVYWFVTRPWTNQDSTISKNPVLMRQSLMDSLKDFPAHTMEMIRNCDMNMLHLTDLKYRPPWDLLLDNFRRGTVTVAGDAMHGTGPFIAQGGAASIEDAIVLARCLAKKMHNNDANKRVQVEDNTLIEEAFDEYVKERRMRIFWLSLNSFFIGKKLDAQSLIVKVIIVALIVVLFRDPDWHIHYQCGTL
ncbi:monooxygenase 1-like [Arachis stenosperma]|uniref:monooxygenase 1-like n=1 Tax=Arachis stenosperma TaxID=217475 RepID=UPI0025AB819F|nr:monooxygenase 1-like [Arachis stenosperma]